MFAKIFTTLMIINFFIFVIVSFRTGGDPWKTKKHFLLILPFVIQFIIALFYFVVVEVILNIIWGMNINLLNPNPLKIFF